MEVYPVVESEVMALKETVTNAERESKIVSIISLLPETCESLMCEGEEISC